MGPRRTARLEPLRWLRELTEIRVRVPGYVRLGTEALQKLDDHRSMAVHFIITRAFYESWGSWSAVHCPGIML